MRSFFFALLVLTCANLPAQTTVRIAATLNLELSNPQTTGRIVILMDGNHAPRSMASFMLLAQPIDQTYRNTLINVVNNNPSGTYRAVNPDTGALIASGRQYTIVVSGSFNPSSPGNYLPDAQAVLRFGNNVAATFTLVAPGTNANWVSNNPNYRLNHYTNSNPTYPSNNRFQVEFVSNPEYLDEFSGDVTTGPFYDNRVVEVKYGNQPSLSIGDFNFEANFSPGWALQNEIVDQGSNNFDDPDAVFGDRFANRFGNLAGQGYAVAWANRSRSDLNTAGAELLITGVNGDPSFRGRHTYLGYVTTDFGGRVLVEQLLAGTREGIVTSIDFTTVSGEFEPTFYSGQLPSLTTKPGRARFKQVGGQTYLTTGALKGEVRYVDGSTNLTSWTRYASSSFSPALTSEPGIPMTDVFNGSSRGFFRVNETVLVYPSWPAEEFDPLELASIRFKGRANDAPGAAQVVNNFDLFYNSSNGARVLAATVGDLAGTHAISSMTYAAKGPFVGELILESETFDDPLKLRLYFDAHKPGEYPELSGQNVIDRYHRVIKQTVTIPPFGSFEFEQVSEFGIWQVQ